MKVFAGSICGQKKQSTQFVSTGQAKGSYPVYVCDRTLGPRGGGHRGRHHDSIHNVDF